VFDGVLSSLACDRLCFSIMQARCQGSEGFAVLQFLRGDYLVGGLTSLGLDSGVGVAAKWWWFFLSNVV